MFLSQRYIFLWFLKKSSTIYLLVTYFFFMCLKIVKCFSLKKGCCNSIIKERQNKDIKIFELGKSEERLSKQIAFFCMFTFFKY